MGQQRRSSTRFGHVAEGPKRLGIETDYERVSLSRGLGLAITSFSPESRAPHAGVRVRDRIVGINDRTVTRPEDVIDALNTGPSDHATVEVDREGHRHRFDVDLVPETDYSVLRAVRRGEIADVTLSHVSSNTPEHVFQAVSELVRKGGEVSGMVIDVLGVEGGDALAPYKLCNLSLPAGQVLNVQRDRSGRDLYVLSTTEQTPLPVPFVILQDGKTDSSGAVYPTTMAQFGAAVLMGEPTGTKQRTGHAAPLPSGQVAVQINVSQPFPGGGRVTPDGVPQQPHVDLNQARVLYQRAHAAGQLQRVQPTSEAVGFDERVGQNEWLHQVAALILAGEVTLPGRTSLSPTHGRVTVRSLAGGFASPKLLLPSGDFLQGTYRIGTVRGRVSIATTMSI